MEALTIQHRLYDVLITWHTGYERARLKSHSKWHRGVLATSLTEACNIALSNHTDKILPSVSMCWPQHKKKV